MGPVETAASINKQVHDALTLEVAAQTCLCPVAWHSVGLYSGSAEVKPGVTVVVQSLLHILIEGCGIIC